MMLEALILKGQMNCKEMELERYGVAHQQQLIVATENWWDKYRVTLRDIETERDVASERLNKFLGGLGYA